MPLRCLDGDKTELAFQHDAESWIALRERRAALTFPCCDAAVVLKTSRLGTRYFAHKARAGCESAGETAEHLRAKAIICQALLSKDWKATPEHRLEDDAGLCVVDVAGYRSEQSSRGIAFEIQWSPQANDVTAARSARYEAHGLRSLWLTRQKKMPVSKDVPTARLALEDDNFVVYLPKQRIADHAFSWASKTELDDLNNWVRCGSLHEFIVGVLEGKLQFGLPDDVTVGAKAEMSQESCYKCKHVYPVFRGVMFRGGKAFPGLGEAFVDIESLTSGTPICHEVLKVINTHLRNSGARTLQMRKSATRRETYLANTCPKCGAMFGSFYLASGPYGEERSYDFNLTCKGDELLSLCRVKPLWNFVGMRSTSASSPRRKLGASEVSVRELANIMAGMRTLP